MIGGLQANMRHMVEWTDKHEAADQRRFEELSRKIGEIELHRAEAKGSWKALSFIGVAAGSIGSFLYHLFGPVFR